MKKQKLGTFKCSSLGCGGLRLTFNWAAVGTTLYYEHVNYVTVRLSTRKTKKSSGSTVVKETSNRKYINVAGIIDPGYIEIYQVGTRVFELRREVNEENLPERIKMKWNRNDERITSTGNVVIPTYRRKQLFESTDEKADAFKVTIDISRGPFAEIEPISSASPEYQMLLTRKDYQNKYGTAFLEKCVRVKYKIPFPEGKSYMRGRIAIASQFVRMLINPDENVDITYKEKDGLAKSIVISKTSFLCPTCGNEEMWDISKKVAVHVCPRCSAAMHDLKKLVPAHYLSDREAIEKGCKKAEDYTRFYKGLIYQLSMLNAKYDALINQ